MSNSLNALQQKFDLPGKLTIKAGHGQLPCVNVHTPLACATIYLHGAHITHFQPAGTDPVLFMSEKSEFAPNKPIRGGVPICFPWFGQGPEDKQTPPHGFARILPWELTATSEQNDGSIEVVLTLKSNDQTRKLWPVDFELIHRVTVGSSLTMSLEMHNTGSGELSYEAAMHTYFVVGDIHQSVIEGLQGSEYLSKVEGGRYEQGDKPVTFDKETDRVYDSAADTVIDDPKGNRKIHVKKTHSKSTVVWNPWIAKSKAMADFGDNEWPGMVCVETANVKNDLVKLAPGSSHLMTANLSVTSR